jgi:hypothetical protein
MGRIGGQQQQQQQQQDSGGTRQSKQREKHSLLGGLITAPSFDPGLPFVHGGGGGSSSSSAKPAGAKAGSIPLPKDFDWRSYLIRYADLRASGVRGAAAAAAHYTSSGHRERRSYRRVPVLLRYTACQGLFNQMFAHLNALVLAEYLGADVVLPPSVYRCVRVFGGKGKGRGSLQ